MSTFKYYDMFIKSQSKGNFHMFIFNIIGSKKMEKTSRIIASIKTEELMLKIYKTIKEIEIKEKKKILVTNIDEILPYELRYLADRKYGMLFEPFLFSDTFGFTIYRNSLTKEEIISIYKKHKQELNITFDFHIGDAYYETNKYEERINLFFRGYCIDILSNYHKDYNKKLKKKNKRMYNS